MVQLYSQITPAGIKGDRIVKLKGTRGTLVNLSYHGNKVEIQTPPLPLAWATTVRKQESGGTTCNLALSFAGDKDTTLAFRQWLEDVSEHIVGLVKEHYKEWFPEVAAVDEVTLCSWIKPLINKASDPRWSDTFAPKVTHKAKEDSSEEYDIQIRVFDADKKPIDDVERALVRGTRAVAIVELPYIHCSKGMKVIGVKAIATKVIAVVQPSADDFDFDTDDKGLQEMLTEAHGNKKRKVEEDLRAGSSENGDAEDTDFIEEDGLAAAPAPAQPVMADTDDNDDV